ncbi:hypothetical protein MN116_003737 [Schistosoma mekongi]|uniref:BEACH domain-containing protein n=1 Tax=Schistosoma mekongi TaxID=38744 RepID=A0AAE1ZFD6_SCHME|nr:hypothetical protein MN116_003737 [Schistosoma mekongi]
MTERIVWKFPTSLLDSQLNHYDHTCHPNNFVSELIKAELRHLWCNCFDNHRSFLQNNINRPVSVTTTYKAILVKFIDILSNPNNLNLIKCINFTHDENELIMDYDLVGASLYDVIKYSPGRLRNHNTLLFLAYQVIHTIKQLHEMNLPHGGITLHNIFIDEKFNIFLGLPKTIEIFSNMKVDEVNEGKHIVEDKISACNSVKLSMMTTNWVLHKVSNYDYLMFLNELAGRHKGDPSNSAILPWITNFDTPSGQLRDLTKSKYHLCKGEDQLNANFTASLHNHTISKRPSWALGSYCSEANYDDRNYQDFMKLCDESGACNLNNQNTNLLCSITGEHLSNDIQKNHMNFTFSPHHLLDIMPDLAYYTYMARQTPLSVLTQFVRPIYQPQEFPTSIARLYESTPDECIPEFFTDVSVFSSIHPDMPDLGLPFWCSSPEEFIKYHSSLLESDEVSSNLHHWIDLNFGYKLLGSDAVNAKNVHLELSGDQSSIRRTGVVCLFHTPHPQRICSKNLSKYFGATLPDIFQTDSHVLAPGNNLVIKKVHTSNSANKVTLAQNNSTLRKQMKSVSGSKVNYTPKLLTDDGVPYSKNKIWLPDDYDPLELINIYQSLCKFLYVETHVDDLNELQPIHLSKLNNYDNNFDNLFRTDLESLGCLIVELSLYYAVSYIEANKWSHEERVSFARLQARLHWDKIPNCLHDAVNSVLYPFNENLSGKQFQNRFLPTVDIFLQLICEFPPYIVDLLYVRDWLINITNDNQSFQQLQSFSPYLPKTCLFAAFLPCNRQNELYDLMNLSAVHIPMNIIKLLYPHIQSAVSANPSWFLNILNSTKMLGLFSLVGGIELVRSHLLPLIISLYKPEQLKRMSSDISSGIPVALLYSRCFLRRLLAYLDVNTFLVHIVPYITLVLIGGSINALTDENIIWHLRSFTGLTNELDTSDLNAKRNTPDSFSHSMDLNDESIIYSQSENVSTTPYDLLFDKQDTMKVDEIGIDLRSLLNDDELQFLEDSKSASLIACAKSNDEECDIASRKSVDGCLIDVISTLPAYSSSSISQYSKLSQLLYDDVTEDKPEQKKVSSSDSTSVINSNSSNFSNVNNIPPVTAAMDSLDWLARRIGPVMTIKYIIKYLLSTLILCYEGKSQLSVNTGNMASSERCFQFHLQVNNCPLLGDRSASSVLRCLEQLIQIYGVSLVLDVYLPYVLKTITSITSPAVANEDTNMNSLKDINDYSMNPTEINNSYKTNVCTTLLNWNYRNLAQLIGALTLFYHIVIYLPDNELVELLQESVLQDILIKAVQISGRLDVNFPGGVIGRRAILYKFINVVFVIGIRVGFELSRTQLTSIFQVFFALFDRVINTTTTKCIFADNSCSRTSDIINNDVGDKCHPESQCTRLLVMENVEITKKSNPTTVFTELIETFNSDLARLAYISFCHLAGGSYIDDCLYNTQSIQKLINQLILNESNSASLIQSCYSESSKTIPVAAASTDIQDVKSNRNKVNFEATLFSSSTLCSNSRFHLPLTWRHVIRDIHVTSSQHPSSVLKYHGVQVAAFTGHINKINCITHLNTENCFVTTSRDKTVQLWSLTDSYNSGYNSISINQRISNISNNISHSTKSVLIDSTNNVVARLVYRAHRKSVIAAHYLEPYRLVASIDGRLIFWDPCTGKTVRSNCQWENSSWQNLIAMNCCSVPYGTVICSDQSGFVHLIDPRALHSGRTGSLRFHSGANLASFVINKERPKLETSTDDYSKNANCVSKLTSYYNQSTSSSSITNIMMNITNQFHPYHLSINSLTSVNSSSSITSLMNSSTNMAGLLNCLATSQNGYYLLCGFTTGMITLLDLRMGQVIHIWREYQDAIVDIIPHNLNGFISCNDRSLSFIYPTTSSNPNQNLYTELDNLNYLPYKSSILFRSKSIRIPSQLHNITCLTMHKTNPIFCANSLPSSYPLPSTSRFPIFGSGGGTNNNSTTKTERPTTVTNESTIPLSTATTTTTTVSLTSQSYYSNNNNSSGTVLATYSHSFNSFDNNSVNPNFYTLGRISSSFLRGSICVISSLSESDLLLVGSDTGSLNLLY